MRPEARCTVAPVLTGPLLAGALLSGCSSGAQPEGNVAAPPAAEIKPQPTEVAQRLVRQRIGAEQAVRFSAAEVFDSEGATIVCGRFARGEAAEQRYIAIGEEDLFVEGEMEPGHMDRAAAEFCRKA